MKKNVNNRLRSLLHDCKDIYGVSTKEITRRILEMRPKFYCSTIHSFEVRISNLKRYSIPIYENRDRNNQFNQDLCSVLSEILNRKIDVEDVFGGE